MVHSAAGLRGSLPTHSAAHRCTRCFVQRFAQFSQPNWRTCRGRKVSVEVHASKRKGKTAYRGGTGAQQQMPPQMAEPETPPVDVENEEFVIFVRCIKPVQTQMGPQPIPWTALSVVKGGQAANVLVQQMASEWGRKLFQKQMIRNIAMAIYKDRKKIESGIRSQGPPQFKTIPSKDFEYAFKIRDKSNPKDWRKAENLTLLPSEEDAAKTVFDNMREFFSGSNLKTIVDGGAVAEQ